MKKILTLITFLCACLGVSAADWYVSGNGTILNGKTWDHTAAENKMTQQADGTFQLKVEDATLEAGVAYEWLCTDGTNWIKNGSDNYKLNVTETAVYSIVYTLTLDASGTTGSAAAVATKTGDAGEITHTYTVAGVPTLLGSNWDVTDTSNDMALQADGTYQLKKDGLQLAKGSYEYKVAVDHAWGLSYPSSNAKLSISESGLYNVTFTFNATSHNVGATAELVQEVIIEETYAIAGDNVTLFGTAWDATIEANKMTKGADGIWTKNYTDVELSEGAIEWKVVHNGSEWIPADNVVTGIPQTATYDITFSYDPATQQPKADLTIKGGGTPTPVTAEGWPANYGGVMLQGFYWNSFEDTKLTTLNKQVEELSKYFDLVWLPNTGATGSEGMGYMPLYWFDHNSNFGREKTLRNLIKNFNEHGTKVIEDVVLNHKAPLGKDGSWIDFVNETWTWEGQTYEINWTGADICRNDDGGHVAAQGWPVTGSDDTGDDFSGGRDLDHTSANVQKNCKLFLDYLLKDLGYSGFRLDMVKGYSPYYTKMYNESSKPEFCVGEYWDGYDAIVNWIKGTGWTSAAFDFPLKYVFRDAFGGGDWSALNTKGMAGDPNVNRYAVTFIDNHDTYENEGRLVNNVLPANAFMLAMPGTPCIFLKHWQRYPIAIGNMILARKACGLTNQSPITEQQLLDGGYVIKTQGTKGTVMCIVGFPSFDTTGFKVIASGTNFAYFVSDNISVEGLREGSDDEESKDITLYVESAEAPYIYAWNGAGQPVNGAWPGTQVTTSEEVDGRTFWTRTFSTVPVNIIINNGGDKQTDDNGETVATGNNAVQTSDITGLTHDSYFTFDATNSDKLTNWTDITSQYYTPEPIQLPACAKVLEGHLYCYFQGNKDYDSPRAWVWGNDDKNFTGGAWPGARMTRVGDDGQGHLVWLWDAGEMEEIFDTATPDPSLLPTGILFSNNGDPKTDDMVFENGGYYDALGLLGNVSATLSIDQLSTVTGKAKTVVYDLQGRIVDNSRSGLKKGIYVQGAKKFIVK